MSLAQITEKIRNDAQKEADEILSKAKAQAEAITSKAEKECAGIQEGFDERFGAERPEIMKRREIVANIDVSKMMLSAKRELTIGTELPIIVASAYVATGKVDFLPDLEMDAQA